MFHLASLLAPTHAVEEPKFALGEMILHSSKGYRGVVCGWDLACCESEEWQAAAGVRCGRSSPRPHAACPCRPAALLAVAYCAD